MPENENKDADKSVVPAEPVKTVNVVSVSALDKPYEDDILDEESDTVVLVASSLPLFVSAYRDGDLTFTANGTEVPADEADSLIENAAANGVALTRKAN